MKMNLHILFALQCYVIAAYSKLDQVEEARNTNTKPSGWISSLLVKKRTLRYSNAYPLSNFGDYGYLDYEDKHGPRYPSEQQGGYMPDLNIRYDALNENQSVPTGKAPLRQTVNTTPNNQISEQHLKPSGFSVDANWPDPKKQLGQLSAVSIDVAGNVVVFHRGDRVWGAQTFTQNNEYNQGYLGAIQENTVVVFNSTTGSVVREWGNNLFYMPHGLTVDKDNNVWITDVALHQVFKFPPNGGNNQPVLTLGEKFKPGNDDTHFCKPTGVAVMSNGDFFVSDGYCNARIIKYGKDGQKMTQWGQRFSSYGGFSANPPPPYAFAIPHALALAEDRGILCAADRENGRIQCFNMINGTFLFQLHYPLFGSRLFSVAYCSVGGGHLFAVNGPEFFNTRTKVQGFIINMETKALESVFSPSENGFSNPHDLAVSKDGRHVYVVELDPFKVWKFSKATNNTTQHNESQLKSPMPSQDKDADKISGKLYNGKNTTKLQAEAVNSNPSNVKRQGLIFTIEVISAVVITIVINIIVIVIFLRVRKQGSLCGYSFRSKKWNFHNTPSDGFKLGQFLDPHSGFEKLCTEESDDEDASRNSELEPITSRIQHA